MPRLPQQADFDQSLTVSITKNPESGRPPANVLVLLHGLGDSEAPFTRLAGQLQLPSTCVVAARAPHPLPFDLPGFHWGDDVHVNQGTGTLDPDAGFHVATRLLRDSLLSRALLGACAFQPRDVVLWGFGQGGMAALALAAAATSPAADGQAPPMAELGGVIAIGGPLPEDVGRRGEGGTGAGSAKLRTPVLLIGGAANSLVTDAQTDRVKRLFEFVEKITWRRSGDGMPRDRGEMTPIMQFLARRLRAAAPSGFMQV